MKNKQLIGVLAVVLLAAGGAAWTFMRPSEPPVNPGRTLVATKQKGEPGKKAAARKHDRNKRTTSVVSTPEFRKPPAFEIGKDEEARLTETQRKLLADIRAALEAEDHRSIFKFVRKIQSLNEWPDGIPDAIKKASLEALDWCGGTGALPELIGFLGDANPNIVRQAVSQWEDAIAECDHDKDLLNADGSIREEGLATHIIAAARVITDAEAMESVLSEIASGMRHSVAAQTILEISESGNQVAIDKLADVISNLTDDGAIKTVEQLQEWLEKNPDDPDDNFIYGGEEDSADDDE